MQRIRLAVGFVLVLTVVGTLASLTLPVPKQNNWLAFHTYLNLTITIATLYLGGSFIFVKGFTGFTPRLKRAYGILCIGFSLLGLAFVQLPLALYGGAVEVVFRDTQVTSIAFLGALIAIYIGTRSFAKLFDVNNITTAWWFLIIPPLILATIYAVLPHAPASIPEIEFDGGNGFNVFNMWVALLALLHTLQVKRIAGIQYTNALAWLAITFSIMLASVVAYLALILPLSDEQWLVAGIAPLVPLVFASVCFLRAAYAFNRITAAQGDAATMTSATARSFFGKPQHAKESDVVSSVDIVTYTANLASDPRNIDPLLDRLRYITSRANGQPSVGEETNQEELKQIYLDVERYLLQEERLRAFTQQSLRQTVAKGLRLDTVHGTFWDTFSRP